MAYPRYIKDREEIIPQSRACMGYLRKVYKWYVANSQKAHESDITLTLPHLILYFPSPAQLLARLEIRNIPSSNLTLSYENQVLRSPTQALTRGLVGRVLGPTYSGEGGALSYPGIKLSASSSKPTASREDTVETIIILPKEEGVVPPVISLTKVVVHVRPLPLPHLSIANISRTRE